MENIREYIKLVEALYEPAIPNPTGTFELPELSSSRPYGMYRLMMHMATHPEDSVLPTGIQDHSLVYVYSQQEYEMITNLFKRLGLKYEVLKNFEDAEPKDTNTKSPVPSPGFRDIF